MEHIHGHSSAELYSKLFELCAEACVASALEVPCVLEIGTAEGGSAVHLMNAIHLSDRPGRLVTCDPWGERPYPASGSRYGSGHERKAMCQLAKRAAELEVSWQHERREGLHFLLHCAPLGFWQHGVWREFRWAFAFVDGEHVWRTVEREIEEITGRLAAHGVIVVDNVNHQGENGENGMQGQLTFWASENGFGTEFFMPPDGSEVCILRKL